MGWQNHVDPERCRGLFDGHLIEHTIPSSTSPTSSSTTPAPSSSSSSALTLSVVATHKTQADCWAAINGKVYNLTDWIGQHPGGAEPIIGLCGTDATSAFAAQHGSQQEPNERLAQFLVGTLAG